MAILRNNTWTKALTLLTVYSADLSQSWWSWVSGEVIRCHLPSKCCTQHQVHSIYNPSEALSYQICVSALFCTANTCLCPFSAFCITWMLNETVKFSIGATTNFRIIHMPLRRTYICGKIAIFMRCELCWWLRFILLTCQMGRSLRL